MPRNQSEAKQLEDQPSTPKCQHCGAEEWDIMERATISYSVTFTSGDEIVADSSNRHIHEDDCDYQLECANCGSAAPMPDPVHIDWV